jgi:hypothetical protein
MKKSLIALGFILALTGCSTNQDKYFEAVKAREDRLAAEENRIDSQIAAIGASGDATAKGMAIMYFARKDTGSKSMGQIAPPQNQALEWARLLLNPIVSIYGINRNTSVQLANIGAETEKYGATMGTIQGIATGAFNSPTYLPMQPSETPTYLPVTPGTQSLRPVEATPTAP